MENKLENLSCDVATIISEYNRLRLQASTNRTMYEYCKTLYRKLESLCEFAEKYMGYKIEVEDDSTGNQYKPSKITGYSIREVQDEDSD